MKCNYNRDDDSLRQFGDFLKLFIHQQGNKAARTRSVIEYE